MPEERNLRISIKILSTEAKKKDVQIMQSVCCRPSFVLDRLTECPSSIDLTYFRLSLCFQIFIVPCKWAFKSKSTPTHQCHSGFFTAKHSSLFLSLHPSCFFPPSVLVVKRLRRWLLLLPTHLDFLYYKIQRYLFGTCTGVEVIICTWMPKASAGGFRGECSFSSALKVTAWGDVGKERIVYTTQLYKRERRVKWRG